MYVIYDGFKNKDGFHSWADVAKKKFNCTYSYLVRNPRFTQQVELLEEMIDGVLVSAIKLAFVNIGYAKLMLSLLELLLQ